METTISECPVCGRKLRIPSKEGDFLFTCPSCRSRWDAAAVVHFEPDPSRLAPLRPCATPGTAYAGRAASCEWAQNVLSVKTVAYGSGRIAREGDRVLHDVDPSELRLCRGLAEEATAILKGKVDGGLGTEGAMPFDPFWAAANRGGPSPERLDDALIREAFGGAIYPLATVEVQRLSEDAKWWREVRMSARESRGPNRAEKAEAFLSTWRELLRWFAERPEFVDRGFAAIGDFGPIDDLVIQGSKRSGGMLGTPSRYPRLFAGLTRGGSLAGIVTHVVKT
jgi:hypothetical protein